MVYDVFGTAPEVRATFRSVPALKFSIITSSKNTKALLHSGEVGLSRITDSSGTMRKRQKRTILTESPSLA